MITVGKHSIGPGQSPFIIAEVGSNWQTFEDCKNSVALAKAVGADAVKFQIFTPEALYGMNCIDIKSLPAEWLPKLKEKAEACGIEFMCTAFSPELYDVVDPFVRIHKIASAEACHLRILEKVKSYGKPVILSTGAKGEADIKAALSVLGDTPTILMYCVAAYPARVVNLELLPMLASTYGKPVGYSDHTTDALVVPDYAVSKGACVIEKHVTFIEAATPDSPHSLNADEFKLMVQRLRRAPISAIGPTPEELGMVNRHNRRLIATRDIQPQEMLQEGVNFGIYRSLKDDTHALHPFAIQTANGAFTTKAIKAGDGIGPGDYLA